MASGWGASASVGGLERRSGRGTCAAPLRALRATARERTASAMMNVSHWLSGAGA